MLVMPSNLDVEGQGFTFRGAAHTRRMLTGRLVLAVLQQLLQRPGALPAPAQQQRQLRSEGLQHEWHSRGWPCTERHAAHA